MQQFCFQGSPALQIFAVSWVFLTKHVPHITWLRVSLILQEVYIWLAGSGWPADTKLMSFDFFPLAVVIFLHQNSFMPEKSYQ